MRTAIVLFTRDLRVHDNPALAVACAAAERVVPLFVHDPAIRSNPTRHRFLAACLADLRAGLRAGLRTRGVYRQRLVDADVTNNHGNWQWVAGTGNDTRPYHRPDPTRPAQRFDPDGAYVRGWLT